MKTLTVLSFTFLFLVSACTKSRNIKLSKQPNIVTSRMDGAILIDISATGSLQNPAWSPDSRRLLFTQFTNGYNNGPANIGMIDLGSLAVNTVVSNNSDNVNLPGSCWNALTDTMVFSSDNNLPHDEIYAKVPGGQPGSEVQITNRQDNKAYEPTLSPDGKWIVFESHPAQSEANGVITRFPIGGGISDYLALTPSGGDCREPNWSPAGDLILYQQIQNGQWDIWVMNADGSKPRQVTTGPGEKTDASFSPDGKYIVYSSDEGGENNANLYITPTSGGKSIKASSSDAYDGAPSWSPDGKQIAFESTYGVQGSGGNTRIWAIKVPPLTAN